MNDIYFKDEQSLEMNWLVLGGVWVAGPGRVGLHLTGQQVVVEKEDLVSRLYVRLLGQEKLGENKKDL